MQYLFGVIYIFLKFKIQCVNHDFKHFFIKHFFNIKCNPCPKLAHIIPILHPTTPRKQKFKQLAPPPKNKKSNK